MNNPLRIAHIRPSSKTKPSDEFIARVEEMVAKWRERNKKKAGRLETKDKNDRA